MQLFVVSCNPQQAIHVDHNDASLDTRDPGSIHSPHPYHNEKKNHLCRGLVHIDSSLQYMLYRFFRTRDVRLPTPSEKQIIRRPAHQCCSYFHWTRNTFSTGWFITKLSSFLFTQGQENKRRDIGHDGARQCKPFTRSQCDRQSIHRLSKKHM